MEFFTPFEEIMSCIILFTSDWSDKICLKSKTKQELHYYAKPAPRNIFGFLAQISEGWETLARRWDWKLICVNEFIFHLQIYLTVTKPVMILKFISNNPNAVKGFKWWRSCNKYSSSYFSLLIEVSVISRLILNCFSWSEAKEFSTETIKVKSITTKLKTL